MKKPSEIADSKKSLTPNEKHDNEKVESDDLSLGDIVEREVMRHWSSDSTIEEVSDSKTKQPARSKESDKDPAIPSNSGSWTSDDSTTIRRNKKSHNVSKIKFHKKSHNSKSDVVDKRSSTKAGSRPSAVSERVPCNTTNQLLNCRLLYLECKVSLERLKMNGLTTVNVENAKDLLCCSKKPRNVILSKEPKDKAQSAGKMEAYCCTTKKNSKKKKRT